MGNTRIKNKGREDTLSSLLLKNVRVQGTWADENDGTKDGNVRYDSNPK
jgi:hypothetical protein